MLDHFSKLKKHNSQTHTGRYIFCYLKVFPLVIDFFSSLFHSSRRVKVVPTVVNVMFIFMFMILI